MRGLGIYFNFNYQDISDREREKISELYAEYTLFGFFTIIITMISANYDDYNENIGRILSIFTNFYNYHSYFEQNGRQNE